MLQMSGFTLTFVPKLNSLSNEPAGNKLVHLQCCYYQLQEIQYEAGVVSNVNVHTTFLEIGKLIRKWETDRQQGDLNKCTPCP
jgi:hypothetical protein